jgi:hypothetical protein
MRKQTYRMKEDWRNVSPAERSRQKREREQQKQKEQNELHEIIMKQVNHNKYILKALHYIFWQE